MTKNAFELPWYYRQVPRDFMSSPDVEIMTCEEVGSYFLLLQKAWLGGENCTLPNDPARLAKLARVEKVSDLVLSKFQSDKDGRLFNPRLKDEWNSAVKRSKDASKAAKKSHESGLRSQSGRSATALPPQSDSIATQYTIQNTKNQESKTMQTHASGSESADAAIPASTGNPANVPTEPATRLAQKLAAVLGRDNLKPATVRAWAEHAEGIVAEHGEQTAMQVIQFALVENSDGFWRGRIYAMKNFVRSFNTMHAQMKRGAGTRKAVDPLAARAASLQTGHDFSAMAKGDL